MQRSEASSQRTIRPPKPPSPPPLPATRSRRGSVSNSRAPSSRPSATHSKSKAPSSSSRRPSHTSNSSKKPPSGHVLARDAPVSEPSRSTATSNRTARQVPLPQSSAPSVYSARDIPLPPSQENSVLDDLETVVPDDSISCAPSAPMDSGRRSNAPSKHSGKGSDRTRTGLQRSRRGLGI